MADIRTLHTLGPSGTNLEAAAWWWFRARSQEGDVRLHAELEHALPELRYDGTEAVVACAVYPKLHDLVFGNLDRLRMVDSFLLPTHEMVVAGREGPVRPRSIASHPAPSSLAARYGTVVPSTSNAQAARACAQGEADACVTTVVAARREGLRVIRSFGEVPMVFTVHQAIRE